MASIVITSFMTCSRPLSDRQRLLLYVAVLWELSTLESETMVSDDMYGLAHHVQYGYR